MHCNPFGLEHTQHFRGHMLVIEGDHVTAARELAQGVEVVMATDPNVANGLRSTIGV
jgi:hypothetical protein